MFTGQWTIKPDRQLQGPLPLRDSTVKELSATSHTISDAKGLKPLGKTSAKTP